VVSQLADSIIRVVAAVKTIAGTSADQASAIEEVRRAVQTIDSRIKQSITGDKSPVSGSPSPPSSGQRVPLASTRSAVSTGSGNSER